MISISDMLSDSIDSTLNGIDSFFRKKSEDLQKSFIRSFVLLPNEKITFFNDISIDRCYSVNAEYSSNAPMHNLDNGSIIAETVVREPTTWNFNCKLTKQTHKDDFKRLLELRDTGQLVTVMFNARVVEYLAILNISESITNVHYTSFTISFRKLTFVDIATIPAPQMKKVVSAPKKSVAGKVETKKVIDTSTSGPRVPTKKTELVNVLLPYPFRVNNNYLGL